MGAVRPSKNLKSKPSLRLLHGGDLRKPETFNLQKQQAGPPGEYMNKMIPIIMYSIYKSYIALSFRLLLSNIVLNSYKKSLKKNFLASSCVKFEVFTPYIVYTL